MYFFVLWFNDTATTEIYTYLHTLPLHDALPLWRAGRSRRASPASTHRPRRRDAPTERRRTAPPSRHRRGAYGPTGASHAPDGHPIRGSIGQPSPIPSGLSLSKPRPFFQPRKEERPFDRLRANGPWTA